MDSLSQANCRRTHHYKPWTHLISLTYYVKISKWPYIHKSTLTSYHLANKEAMGLNLSPTLNEWGWDFLENPRIFLNIQDYLLQLKPTLTPSNAEAAFVQSTRKQRNLWKTLKLCHVGIHWIALVEYFQMSTHLPGFQSFFRFFAWFCIGQISHQQHKGYCM